MVGNLSAREMTRGEWRMHRGSEREIVGAGGESHKVENVRKANEINIYMLTSDFF
jgi:hypothetical protein